MRKKNLSRLLEPGFQLYFVCLALFALASAATDPVLAIVEGVDHLKGAPVRALDLRAGAAMVIAGLVAEGTTQVEDVKYIERGYENIVEKLVQLGADIYRRQDLNEEAPENVG